MEKYYVAQLDELNRRNSINKLVEVRFSRRPSTFGVLYVTEANSSSSCNNNNNSRDQFGAGHGAPTTEVMAAREAHIQAQHGTWWLKLATLSLTLDNKAKFMIVKEAKLMQGPGESFVAVPAGQQDKRDKQKQQGKSRQLKALPTSTTSTSYASSTVGSSVIADFDTLTSGQLLIEGSSSSSASQTRLQSAVFVLTRDGQLSVVSMIDCTSRQLITIREQQQQNDNNKKRSRSPLSGRSNNFEPQASRHQSQTPERFIQVLAVRHEFNKRSLSPTSVSSSASSQGAAAAGTRGATVDLIVLSDRCLYSYTITLSNQQQSAASGTTINTSQLQQADTCPVHLNYKYSIQQKQQPHEDSKPIGAGGEPNAPKRAPNVKFTRMLLLRPIDWDGRVLLEHSDGSMRIIRRDKCLARLPAFSQTASCGGGPAQSLLLFPSTCLDEPNIILRLTRSNRLEAHSLVYNMEDRNEHEESSEIIQSRIGDVMGDGSETRDQVKEVDYDDDDDDDGAMNVFERPRGRLQQVNTSSSATSPHDKDPDRLLPDEPNFELEQCWSIDLNEIDGVRSMFDDDEDDVEGREGEDYDDDDDDDGDRHHDTSKKVDNDETHGHEQQPKQKYTNNFLCLPIWPAATELGLSRSAKNKANHLASVDTEDNPIAHEGVCWPRFLFVMCKHHVLVFNFEHANVLPFSVVYDRAFLNLTNPNTTPSSSGSGGGGANSTTNTPSEQHLQDKRIDLRLRPRLLHNVKLIGARASDSLFNMLFLTCRIHLVQAKNFTNLGLLAAVSNMGHVLVFKLTSARLVGPDHKDNLYQQLLADSLRDTFLLQDELNRMQALEMELKTQINKLEMQASAAAAAAAVNQEELIGQERLKMGAGGNHTTTTTTTTIKPNSLELNYQQQQQQQQQQADMLEIKTSLEPHETIGGLYDLAIVWPSLMLTVTKVIVVSTVDGCQLQAPIHHEQQQIDSMTVRPRVRRALVANGEQAQIEQLFQNLVQSGELDDSLSQVGSVSTATGAPAKARVVIELDTLESDLDLHDDGDLHAEQGCSQRGQINVPVSLDEFKVGQLKIYIVFSLPFPDHLSPFGHHQLVSRAGNRSPGQRNENNKYIKRELHIKPLESYRLASSEIPFEHNTTTLSFAGQIGIDKALAWLGGLFDTSDRPLGQLFTGQHKETTLTFRSSSRRCTIQVKLATTDMLFTTNDLKALELIKQHILKVATDDSIQLKPRSVHD